MDKISPIKERILLFIDNQEITKIDFCEKTSIAYANMKGKGLMSEIGGDKIAKILSIYPQLNAEWLLTGKGKMLRGNSTSKSSTIVTTSLSGDNNQYSNVANVASSINETKNSTDTKNASNALMKVFGNGVMKIRIISQYAYAGYLSGYADPEFMEHQPHLFVDESYTPGNYVAFEVRGDSMEDGTRDAIYEGDIVIGRELYREHWKSKFRKGEIYIVVHREYGICIKEIINQSANGTITLHSKNIEYHDYTVNLNDVLQIFYKKEVRRK